MPPAKLVHSFLKEQKPTTIMIEIETQNQNDTLNKLFCLIPHVYGRVYFYTDNASVNNEQYMYISSTALGINSEIYY